MTAKEYLLQLRISIAQLERLKAYAEKTSSIGNTTGGNTSYDRVGITAGNIVDLEKLINNKTKIFQKIKNEIPNPEYRILLELRYIKNLYWHDIAENMFCSLRTLHFWHNKSLDYIDKNNLIEKVCTLLH